MELVHHRAEERLEIVWADRHRSNFSALELRLRCPCADCMTGGGTRTRSAPEVGISVTTIEPFGNYAIAIKFSDGHSAGVYRWDYLRYWCPCDDCWSRRRRADEQGFRGDLSAAAAASNCSTSAPTTGPDNEPPPQPLIFRTR